MEFKFSEEIIERYSAEIAMKEIGGKGLEKLINSTVGVIGAGGLGCPVIQILTAIGIGTIKIIDADVIKRSNLARQYLHYTSDINSYKIESIKRKMIDLNPNVNLKCYNTYLNKENVEELLSDCNFVIDASDNFATKFLINDACVYFDIPFVIAGVQRFIGQIFSIVPGKTACYRCIFPNILFTEYERTCTAMGIISTTTSFAASIEANEAIKSILNLNSRFKGKLFSFDLLNDYFEFIELKINPSCFICSKKGYPMYKYENYELFDNRCRVK